MEIYSIILQSTKPESKGKIFLSTTLAPSFQIAVDKAMAKAIEANGDLGWSFVVHNSLPVIQAPVKAPEVAKTIEEPMKETKNWLLNTIIANKDTKLLKSCKQYLTEPEILYINSKLNEENKTR